MRSGRGRTPGGRRLDLLRGGCGGGVVERVCALGRDRGGGTDLLRFCVDSSGEAEDDDDEEEGRILLCVFFCFLIYLIVFFSIVSTF